MSVLETVVTKKTEIKTVAAKHGTGNVRVFGSVLRGEARPGSDVDLLVDVIGPTTPWFPGGLLNDLEEHIGRRVDVVTSRSLNPLMRDNVRREARLL